MAGDVYDRSVPPSALEGQDVEDAGELEEKREEVRQALSEATERKEAEGVEEPDVEGAEDTVESLQEQLNERWDETTELNLALESVKETIKEIEDIRDELESADERYANIGFLAEAAFGKNNQRMSLQRFVLATRQEEVLQVVNEHIAHMTQNRYCLLRAEEVRDRRRGHALRNLAVRKPEGISVASPFSFEPRSDRLNALDEPRKCRDVRLPARDVLHGLPEREPLVAAEIRHGDGGRPADPGVAEEINLALPDVDIDPANGLLQLPCRDWSHIRDWHPVGREAGVGERMLLGDVQKRIGSLRGRLGLCLRADGKVFVDKPGGSHVWW
jgi:hypothetical protein